MSLLGKVELIQHRINESFAFAVTGHQIAVEFAPNAPFAVEEAGRACDIQIIGNGQGSSLLKGGSQFAGPEPADTAHSLEKFGHAVKRTPAGKRIDAVIFPVDGSLFEIIFSIVERHQFLIVFAASEIEGLGGGTDRPRFFIKLFLSQTGFFGGARCSDKNRKFTGGQLLFGNDFKFGSGDEPDMVIQLHGGILCHGIGLIRQDDDSGGLTLFHQRKISAKQYKTAQQK